LILDSYLSFSSLFYPLSPSIAKPIDKKREEKKNDRNRRDKELEEI